MARSRWTTASATRTQVTFERSPAGAGTWTTIAVDNTPPFTAGLDTTLLTDGVYDLHAVATDGASLATSNIVTTRVDNTAPTAAVTAPPPPRPSAGRPSPSPRTRPTAAGNGRRVPCRRRLGRDRLVGAVAARVGRLGTPSGAHTIDAVVTDAAGNSITTAGVPVTVDSTAPSVTLTNPGSLLAGSVTLHASSPMRTRQGRLRAQPGGVRRLDDRRTDTTPPYAAEIETTAVPTASTTSARSPTTPRQHLGAERRRGAAHRQHPAVLRLGDPGRRLDDRQRELDLDHGSERSPPSPASRSTRRDRRAGIRRGRDVATGRWQVDRTPSPARSLTSRARPRPTRRTSRSSAVRGPPTGPTSR